MKKTVKKARNDPIGNERQKHEHEPDHPEPNKRDPQVKADEQPERGTGKKETRSDSQGAEQKKQETEIH